MRLRDDLVRVSEVWPLDEPHAQRWRVTAVFLVQSSGAFVCVDYRVVLLPARPDSAEGEREHWNDVALLALREDTPEVRARNEDALSFERRFPPGADPAVPGGGIPVKLLKQASPARLLARARAEYRAGAFPRVEDAGQQLLQEPRRKAVGRPTTFPLRTKLQMLEQVEGGDTLAVVADSFHVGRSTVRDIVAWARAQDPPLFTGAHQGRRGGELTEAGRALLQAQKGARA